LNYNPIIELAKSELCGLFYSPLFEPEAFHTGNYKKYSIVGGQHLLQTPTPSIFSAWGVYLVELSLYDKLDGS